MHNRNFGPGCASCVALERRVREALDRSAAPHARVIRVTDYGESAALGAMKTPGRVINPRWW